MVQGRVDDASAVEADHHRQTTRHGRRLEPAHLLQPTHVQLDIGPSGSQRPDVALGAPAQVDVQVGLGVDERRAAVAAQMSGQGDPKQRIIGERDRHGSRLNSHVPTVTPAPRADRGVSVHGDRAEYWLAADIRSPLGCRAMPDAIFADPRLASVYDAFDGDRADLDAYLRIADEFDARHVLDIGCGTGSLAILLAASGRQVAGVDPAGASLDVAMRKPGAASVTWLHGDATTLPALSADIAMMTGNVAQVFLDDDDWSATLHGIRGALRDGGYLVFETRRPERRAWEEWAAATGRIIRTIPGIGDVEQRMEVTRVALPYVSFQYTYTFASDGRQVRSDSTLRFRSRAEVEQTLASNGFTTLDIRQAPDRPGREYIFVAQRTTDRTSLNDGRAPIGK